jgi:RNA polymerase sigma-70 factor (ECF subfamily)
LNAIEETRALGPRASGQQVTAGASFRAERRLDDSEETLRQTRLAVARAKAGDRDALGFLYMRYANNVYGYVHSIVRDDHDAEDVTQQVFAKLITALPKYQERGVPFFAWLLRIARNVAIDSLRSSHPVPDDAKVDDGAIYADDPDLGLAVRDALETLPPEQREVVLLRHLVGLSPGEIADKLGRTEASIHGLHHRGRRSLREALDASGSGPSTRPADAVRRRPKLTLVSTEQPVKTAA